MTDAPDPNPAGWYVDPAGIHHQRFWTGAAWTPRVADAYGVTAVHHLDADYPSPSGDAVAAAPPKMPTPALSLVAWAESEPTPEPQQAPAVEVDWREASMPAPGPRPAGWYADPSGIHCERAWDGSTWGAVVLDRDRALQEHAIHEAFAPPVDVPRAPPGRATFDGALLAGMACRDASPMDDRDGWRPDPSGPFRERFFRGGRPSAVVRTARSRAG